MNKWIVFVWGDVEPSIEGPFATDEERNEKAKQLRQEHGDEHGIYALDVEQGVPEIFAYTGAFFEE